MKSAPNGEWCFVNSDPIISRICLNPSTAPIAVRIKPKSHKTLQSPRWLMVSWLLFRGVSPPTSKPGLTSVCSILPPIPPLPSLPPTHASGSHFHRTPPRSLPSFCMPELGAPLVWSYCIVEEFFFSIKEFVLFSSPSPAWELCEGLPVLNSPLLHRALCPHDSLRNTFYWVSKYAVLRLPSPVMWAV